MRIRGSFLASMAVVTIMQVRPYAADTFRLTVANTFALLGADAGANAPNTKASLKNAFMAVRAEGCANVPTVRVTATAEGLVGSARRSEPLIITPVSPPGAFAVSHPPAGGQWVIALVGTCGDARAGAVVPVTASGFDRDASKFYSRAATPAEIDAALKKAPRR